MRKLNPTKRTAFQIRIVAFCRAGSSMRGVFIAKEIVANAKRASILISHSLNGG